MDPQKRSREGEHADGCERYFQAGIAPNQDGFVAEAITKIKIH